MEFIFSPEGWSPPFCLISSFLSSSFIHGVTDAVSEGIRSRMTALLK